MISSIISFCTHDLRFLDRCIAGVRPFSDQIIIPVCDHLYNGKLEDPILLQRIYAKYPDIEFIEFAYSETEVYGTPSRLVPGAPGWSQHWHSSARLIATYFLRPETEYVLFVDVDEIFSGPFAIEDYDAIRFGCFWYFKRADNVATTFSKGPLCVRRDKLDTEILLDEDERQGMFARLEGKKKDPYLHEGKPLVHHYSWVRSRDEMLSKVRSWNHHWERDWENLIDREDDFVRGYSYKQADPFWDPLKEEISLPKKGGAPLCKVTPKDIFRMEIQNLI